MEVEYDNRDAPSYLAHYGMHRPPFASQTEDEMYYSEPTRDKRLDTLLHLTQYGNELLLVTAPEGGGKTTVMQQFLKNAGTDWKICCINATPQLDEEQLLYRICHCFNLQVESAALPFVVTNVKRQLDQMLGASHTVVIAIDDAQSLSLKILSLLANLSKLKNQKTGAYPRIVLFAEPQIKIQFAAIELENKLKYPARKIDLPPFDEKQTGELIRYRTKMAGLQADNTFTDAAIGKIYKQSEGIPGNIVELAHRVLFEMTPLKRRTKSVYSSVADSAATKSKKPTGLIAGLVAIVVIALILIFQNEISGFYAKKSHRAGPAERAVTSPAIPELPADISNHNAKQQIQSAADATPEHEQPQGSHKPKTTAVFAEDIDSESESAMAPSSFPSGSPNQSSDNIASKSASDKSPLSRKSSSQKKSAPFVTEAGDESLITQVNQAAWVLEQDPDFFTLQLVAGYQKSTINNFLNRYKLSANKLAYFHSLNKGKEWNSLIYGAYPDYQTALQDIDNLPEEVRKAHPWIRPFKRVQKEIREAKQ